MSIDLKKLRYIVAVARAENITVAAETIGLTQSALTRSVAEVEEELGVQLFERLPRGVRVTNVGQLIVDKAKVTLSNFDDLVTSVIDHRDLKSGRLRIGFTPAIFERFVAGQSLEFINQYPDVSFESSSGTMADLISTMIAGQTNLIIGGSFQLSRWPELRTEKIADIQCDILVRRGHPLTLLNQITEKDALQYPLIQPASMDKMHADIENAYTRNKLTPKRGHYVCDDFVMVKRILLATDSFTPFLGLKGDVRTIDDRFEVLEGVLDFPEQSIALAYPLTKSLSPAALEFRRILLRRENWQTRHPTSDKVIEDSTGANF